MTAPDEESRDLVMPFVACKSNGGVYEDNSYVAGFECGLISRILEAEKPVTWELWVHTPNLKQVDLLCMHNSYVIRAVKPWDEHPDEWTYVLLQKV